MPLGFCQGKPEDGKIRPSLITALLGVPYLFLVETSCFTRYHQNWPYNGTFFIYFSATYKTSKFLFVEYADIEFLGFREL